MRVSLTVATVIATLGGTLWSAFPALADDDDAAPPPPPPAAAHHVRYTVSATGPIFSHIYYRDVDPPTWSDYSHNPYEYSPRADVTVGPNQPWVLDATLNDPSLWATVMVQSGESPNFKTPSFNCKLEVDGTVVKQDSGAHGALCSIRNW